MSRMRNGQRWIGSCLAASARSLATAAVAALFVATGAAAPSPVRAQSAEVAAEVASLREAIRENGARWVAGETPLSGLTPEQMRGYLGLLETPAEVRASLPRFEAGTTPLALPASFDWRDRGGDTFVTGVRDQAGCGSCWAFAATAALEARALITLDRPGEELDLAEQTLVSCGGAGSCAGGYLDRAADYLVSTGVPPEECHPYQATNGSCAGACASRGQTSFRAGPYLAVDNALADLKQALAQHGPLPVGMSVYADFRSYAGGVYSHVSGGYLGGHAVLLVGYDDAASCFIVKNSWGDAWGEAGFFRIAYSEVANATGFGRAALAYGPALSPFDEASLGEALDEPTLPWSTRLMGGWFRQTAVSTHGGDALESGRIDAWDTTWVETVIDGPAEISFDEQVVSNYGTLSTLLGGEAVHTRDYRTTGWRRVTLPLGTGRQRLRWSYQTGWGEVDVARLDHVVVGPAGESLGEPSVPSGEVAGAIVGGLYAFTTGGSVSSLDHLVEYRFDWGDGTRSAWSTRTAAEHIWHASGDFVVRAQARCATHPSLRSVWSAGFAVSIAPPLPITLAEALDAPGFVFETGGDVPWFAQNATAYAGGDAAQSGHVTALYGSGQSWIRTTVEGPGGISFFWRLSASLWTDYHVRVDGATYTSISRQRPWQRQVVPLGPGSHVVTWLYDQESPDVATSNAAWLDRVELLPDYEILPTPGEPAGRYYATVGIPVEYTVDPLASNQGHAVEYSFDWGDGTTSEWSPLPRASHAWASAGYRPVSARARCASHPELVTPWSESFSVQVAVLETVAVPAVPTGPAAGFVDMAAIFVSAASDASSSHGRLVRFDWGDGTISDWIYGYVGSPQGSHRWSTPGTFHVRAQARCSAHTDVVSDWSAPATVVISPLPPIGLGAALDNAGLTWTTGGAAAWFAQTADSVAGGSAAQSGPIGAGQTSWIETTVAGPANIYFSWREVAGDPGWMRLYVDGIEQYDPYCPEAWEMAVVRIGSGQHALRWVFSKLNDDVLREDCGRLDQVVVVLSGETVRPAGTIGGPGTGIAGAPLGYTALGGTSSLGHAVEYRFSWGDGSYSDWSATGAATHAWTSLGTFPVRAQTRCATHPAVVSTWSYTRSVAITTPAPAAPTGPSAGIEGASCEFTTAGVVPDPGVQLQYQFDWGVGQLSAWSASPTASYVWTTPGTYQVRVKARPVGVSNCDSPWSGALSVTISPYEVITAPTLTGPMTGLVRTPYAYAAEGASSSLGHTLKYTFWGGNSGWTRLEPSHEFTFSYGGMHKLKVVAACAEHSRYQATSPEITVSISWPDETLTTPAAPTGPAALLTGQAGQYLCSGSVSDLGHAVEYGIDFADGTTPYYSGYGSWHYWTKAGTYQVRARAVCDLDGGTFSAWSPALTVTVSDPPETISTPSRPVGPSQPLIVGDTGVYATEGAASSLGHPVEYRFDFFGAGMTEWSSLPLVAHTWETSFGGSVRAQARCAAHPTMVSAWSGTFSGSVDDETAAAPETPGGPTSGIAGRTYVFHVSEPLAAPRHGGEYKFDWGDGTESGWSADASRARAWPAPGSQRVRVKARCAAHPEVESAWSPALPVVIRQANNLPAALDATALAVETGGDADWSGEPEPAAFGLAAAASGAIADGQSTWMRAAVDGPGEVSFSWRVSAAAGDALVAFLDGVERMRISGEVAWERRTLALGAGRHALLWFYRKDGAGGGGADRGWVDNVVLATQAEQVATPAAPTGPAGGVTETSYAFATAAGLSTKGHALEYRFAWGDGALSPWAAATGAERAWPTPGIYQVAVQARCQSEPSRLSEFSDPAGIVIDELLENVSTPAAPSGTTNIEALQVASFSTAPAVSDLGHPVEYRFDWGDGSLSGWSAETAQGHAWQDAGIFEVRTQSRCAQHFSKQSEWSEAFVVAVSPAPERVSAPLPPAGPAGAKTGREASFALLGAASTYGHALEYRVDWGDGTLSAWGAAASASHAWAAGGSYAVAAQARCAGDPGAESAWSAAVQVAVSDHYDLGEAVENTALAWETGGDAEWSARALPGAAGGDAARRGLTAAGGDSWVGSTVEGPTSLYFLWRVAGVAGRDRFAFSVDGLEQAGITGKTPWLFNATSVGEGPHEVRWRFTRGSQLASAPHDAWLDLVVDDPREITGSVAVVKPAGGEVWRRGQTVTLRWSRTGVIGPAVSVELLARRAGGGWVAKRIAAALPDTGAWAWKVPASLMPGTRYRIRVRSCADPKIAASSARTFTVR